MTGQYAPLLALVSTEVTAPHAALHHAFNTAPLPATKVKIQKPKTHAKCEAQANVLTYVHGLVFGCKQAYHKSEEDAADRRLLALSGSWLAIRYFLPKI
jgi:hypothetical protein